LIRLAAIEPKRAGDAEHDRPTRQRRTLECGRFDAMDVRRVNLCTPGELVQGHADSFALRAHNRAEVAH